MESVSSMPVQGEEERRASPSRHGWWTLSRIASQMTLASGVAADNDAVKTANRCRLKTCNSLGVSYDSEDASGCTYNVCSRVAVRESSSRLGRLDLKLGHDDENANVLREPVAHVSSDADRGRRRVDLSGEGWSRVDGVGGEDFSEGDRRRGQF